MVTLFAIGFDQWTTLFERPMYHGHRGAGALHMASVQMFLSIDQIRLQKGVVDEMSNIKSRFYARGVKKLVSTIISHFKHQCHIYFEHLPISSFLSSNRKWVQLAILNVKHFCSMNNVRFFTFARWKWSLATFHQTEKYFGGRRLASHTLRTWRSWVEHISKVELPYIRNTNHGRDGWKMLPSVDHTISLANW